MPSGCSGYQWTRACIFIGTLTLVTFMYHLYDAQYSNFLDYSNADLLIKNINFNYNASDIPEQKVREGFIVWSEACRIPNITAFHDSIKKIVSRKWKAIKCPDSEKRPMTKLVRNQTTGVTSMQVVDDAIQDYSLSGKWFECCYETISRNHLDKVQSKLDDDRYQLGTPECFKNSSEIAENVEYLYVYCQSGKNTPKIFYKNLHSIVIDKEPKHKIIRNDTAANNETLPSRYSVMLFGIDSISRLNMIRTMPRTKKFLEEHDWTWLEGYNKIGDNTFPNLMAILSGMNMDQVYKTCFQPKTREMDRCPFIWKNYSQQGYLTAYAEDETYISSFNYNKYGFLNAPTDYYTRPYLTVGSKLLVSTKDGSMNYCMGRQPQAEYLFEYATEFVERLQHRLHFSLFWFNSFSHNEVNQPSVMDERVREVLEQMQPYFNSTIVLFFSDHGSRFGPIRQTFVGWLEERLPYMYMWIPPAFRNEYPQKYANLVANRNRLTCPYDIYSTLLEILDGQEVKTPPKACPNCHSLFRKARWNRSCEDIASSPHWCTCSTAEVKESSVKEPAVLNAAYTVLKTVNDLLEKRKTEIEVNTTCAVLTLNKVMSVRSRSIGLIPFRNAIEYVLVMQVNPSNAMFEVTWRSNEPVKLDDISRINMYGSQGDCVTGSSDLKKYCFCVKKT